MLGESNQEDDREEQEIPVWIGWSMNNTEEVGNWIKNNEDGSNLVAGVGGPLKQLWALGRIYLKEITEEDGISFARGGTTKNPMHLFCV